MLCTLCPGRLGLAMLVSCTYILPRWLAVQNTVVIAIYFLNVKVSFQQDSNTHYTMNLTEMLLPLLLASMLCKNGHQKTGPSFSDVFWGGRLEVKNGLEHDIYFVFCTGGASMVYLHVTFG